MAHSSASARHPLATVFTGTASEPASSPKQPPEEIYDLFGEPNTKPLHRYANIDFGPDSKLGHCLLMTGLKDRKVQHILPGAKLIDVDDSMYFEINFTKE